MLVQGLTIGPSAYTRHCSLDTQNSRLIGREHCVSIADFLPSKQSIVFATKECGIQSFALSFALLCFNYYVYPYTTMLMIAKRLLLPS